MPFDLKRCGHLPKVVQKMFTDHTRKTIEVYINDMLVKSLKAEDYWKHRRKLPYTSKMSLKLNLLKYAFEVISRKILDFMVK